MFDGVHAAIALVKDPTHPSPLLSIIAGGVPADDTGAAMIVDMLRDAASAIEEYLSQDRVHTDTSELPTIAVPMPVPPAEPAPEQRRPRFNPQPRGPRP